MELDAVVVIPARDEEHLIPRALEALARQTVPRASFRDDPRPQWLHRPHRGRRRRRGGAARPRAQRAAVAGDRRRTGTARRNGHWPPSACSSSDASTGSSPAPTPTRGPIRTGSSGSSQHVRDGARAIAGLIELDEDDSRALPEAVLRRRSRDAARRLRRVREREPAAGHHHFAGASIGVTAAVYRQVGGLEPVAALEDATFEARLRAHGIAILRAADVRVRTSSRTDGRAPRGLAVDMAVSTWSERRRYDATEFPLRRLASAKRTTSVTVIIPTKQCADTIAGVVAPYGRAAARRGAGRRCRRRRRGIARPDRSDRGPGGRTGPPGGRPAARVRHGAGQGRRDVARAARDLRRGRLLPRR